MDIKLFITGLTIAITAVNCVYYLHGVYCRGYKPHFYTWLIWTLVTAIAAFAQIAEQAGVGAWVTVFITFTCAARALAAYTHGVKNITRSDKVCLAVCVATIILWQLTDNPLLAVLLATSVDLGGFFPMARNAWKNPYDEHVQGHALSGIIYALGVFALEHYSLATVVYPAAVSAASWLFVFYIVWRRRCVAVAVA